MAGHSKWANIQHRKGRQDEKRGKVWTKLIREITVAAKMGGGDIANNPRLRLAIDKAKDSNMPSDNVNRAIQKGTGSLEGVSYEEIRYEGYGPSGVAVIVDSLTDNKIRTVAEVRHAFSKNGGNLGTDGCVGYLFKHCGTMTFGPNVDENQLMDAALEVGADDVIVNDDGSKEVLTSPWELSNIKDQLQKMGLVPEFSEVTMRAETDVELSGDVATSMQKLLDALENLDDVQDVYSNAILED
ncbi:YebC/PmpR family DNA-binding transcriptional regulator [Polynucleobacter kasalickyi]|uniref:Probable transcriptional regulatory protein SAMN06296008_10625 n=1 Tax=Polynucleobacter kasalickyi TaxID=1938817 RepID=A0A1W1ZMR1_9BURK|nr:YebC/PmpR family DNA-binding transcriptional regulator [Polynucleobacter kasalickyi]SMC49696.1 DNA-binding regulatory protein, YebC/PmpR family [Polynucleobacter kasalickyi]